jgi:phosphonate transport system substrate-binding protein
MVGALLNHHRPLSLGVALAAHAEPWPIEAFADGFRELTGRPLEPVWLDSYGAIIEAAQGGRLDLAWSPPVVAIHLEERGLSKPLLAVGRAGVIAYHGAIVVKRGAPPCRTRDLAGKRIAWVAPWSAAGYLVPRLYLASKGLNPQSMFAEQHFAGSHHNAIKLLLDGKVDAAAVFAHAEGREKVSFRVPGPPDALRIVCTAGPIPGDVLVASTALENSERAVLSGALLALRDDHLAPMRKAMSITRFEPLPIGHLDPLRKLAAVARLADPRTS